MNFLNCFGKKVFLILLSLIFLGNCFAEVQDVLVKKNELLQNLNAILFKQILEQDFSQDKDKILASYLDYELKAKYELVSNFAKNKPDVAAKEMEVLNLLIAWQKKAQAKLEVILVVKEDLFNEYELRSIRLHILERLYTIVQKFWDGIVAGKVQFEQLQKHVDDKFISGVVRCSINKKLSSEIIEYLKIDFECLLKDSYLNYQNLINKYRVSKNNLVLLDEQFKKDLDELLRSLVATKNALTKGREEKREQNVSWKKTIKQKLGFACIDAQDLAINFFQSLIFKLLKINNEITQAKLFFVSFEKFKPSRKEILFKHTILNDDIDVKSGEFSAYFDTYKNLVEEFLNNEKLDENFSFRLEHCLYDLKKFRNQKEAKGSLYSLGIFKDSAAIKNCFLIDQMISILENVAKTLRVEKEGLIGKGEQFFEQLFNGEIKIPDKFKKFVGAFVQSLMTN